MGIFTGLAAGLVSGAVSAFGASRANKAAQAAASRQMEFQRESAQNSYQWAVADMKKAGINPMLAYQQGGAQALSGASYSPQNELAGGSAATNAAVNTALAVKKQRAEIKNITEDTRVKRTQGQLNDNLGANAVQNWNILREEVHTARAARTQANLEEKFFRSRAGVVVKNLDLIGRGVNPFATTARGITRGR